MREILFRGKRIDNGEWVYGCLLNNIYGASKPVIISGSSYADDNRVVIDDWEFVDPKTIGQYTGLKDINGKKIFEGDYIGTRIWSEWDDTTVYLEGYVRFINGGFFIKSKTLSLDVFIMEERYEDPYFKIIGNIHDNPELLKDSE